MDDGPVGHPEPRLAQSFAGVLYRRKAHESRHWHEVGAPQRDARWLSQPELEASDEHGSPTLRGPPLKLPCNQWRHQRNQCDTADSPRRGAELRSSTLRIRAAYRG